MTYLRSGVLRAEVYRRHISVTTRNAEIDIPWRFATSDICVYSIHTSQFVHLYRF